MQTSTTAHAGTDGVCSVRVVGTRGEGPELLVNAGAGVKTGQLVELDFAAAPLGDVVYLEFKNNSATTWRPHWARVLDRRRRQEWYIYSRQWVSKTRTQRAYAEASDGHLDAREELGDAVDDRAHARSAEKYSANWDLCYTEKRGGTCRNKNCKWRHLKK